ncbi:11142_t:CDS:2 [Entrophospora sp. SA101]|nr:11142_t:CDS:2 [Entrophospora sp. SA101]
MVDRSIESVITTTISSPSSSKTVESIISSSSSPKKYLSFEQSCAKILMQRYGPHLFHVAKIIFLARFMQLLLHHYRNRNHRKYLRYDEVDDVNDELIDELKIYQKWTFLKPFIFYIYIFLLYK